MGWVMKTVGFALLLGTTLAIGACRPAVRPGAATAAPRPSVTTDPIARGATLYAAYCGGCHGPQGHGDGPVASVIAIRPADLRAPGLLERTTDAELVGRIMQGEPLRASPRRSAVAEDLEADAIIAYLRTLATSDWELLRVGRFVFEGTCAPCHGAYGHGEGVLGATNDPPPPDLHHARERYTDAALTTLVVDGFGTMPPLVDVFAPGEVRAVVAFVRHLSKGYRLYDTYCASCHGDDGRGVHPEDLLPPATPAPVIGPASIARLGPAAARAKVLHMLRREAGSMPHFRDTLTEAQIRDVVAYLRSGG